MNSMSSRQTMATVFYLLFGTGFCSGITEEMMFRGYMTKISERHWGKISAIIAPTLLFTLGHYRAGMDILTFLKQSLFMISFSILLTIVTYQSGQIWDAALIHAIWDIFAVSNGVYSVDYGMSPNTFFYLCVRTWNRTRIILPYPNARRTFSNNYILDIYCFAPSGCQASGTGYVGR